MRIIFPCLISLFPAATFAQDLRIVTDIAPIHSLVSMIAGPDVQVDVLVSGAASPHDFQFSFDQAQVVQDADLIIWAGEDLTPWLAEALATLAPNVPTLELLEADGWTKLALRTDAAFETEGHDHGGHTDEGHDDHADEHEDHADEGHDDHVDEHEDHGHEAAHGRTDPHAWLDPRVATAWQGLIADALSSANPDGQAEYSANLERANADLSALQDRVQARFEGVPQAPYLVPHDAYQYFEQLLDRPAAGAIALSDAVAPSPARIAELQALVAGTGVVCVLTDPQSRAEWSDLVREGTDARTALIEPLGSTLELGPDQYTQTITAMADAFVACLKG